MKQPERISGQEEAVRLLNLAANLLEQGQVENALHYLEEAHSLDAESIPVRINLGGAYVMSGRHKKAIPILEAARDAEPDNSMIWINLAAAYLGNPVLATREQETRAIEAFDRALYLNPAAPNVHYNLGLIFLNRGDRDLAVQAFRQAVQVNPFDRDAYLWLHKLGALDEGTHHGEGEGVEEDNDG
jgi:tetratricopeptide (TPR) repeat protein